MPTLADIYSAINTARRKGADFVQNPGTSLQQILGQTQENLAARRARDEALWNQAHGDPMNPLRVTDPNAFKQEVSNSMDLMSFAPAGMTVWHGSPHVFEAFNSSKIGAGQGSQAYGKGLYMTESLPVAEGYAKSTAAQYADEKSLLKMKEYVARQAGKIERADELAKELKKYDKSIYKVDLPDTHVRRMLDWDIPLKDQPRHVRDLAKRLGLSMNDLGGDLVGQIGKGEEGRLALQQAGIPGIKYMGQEKGNTGRNFVVFDPNHLTILERNAQPIK